MTPRAVLVSWCSAAVLVIAATVLLQPQGSGPSTDAPVLVGAPSPAEVTAINLVRSDGDYRFERDGEGAWWQVRPFRHRMDTAQLMAIPEALQRLRAVARLPLDAQQAGVLGVSGTAEGGRPLATLRLERADGDTVVLHLGRTGIGGRGWLRVGDAHEALVVDSDLHAIAIQEAPQTWRDARLLPDVGPSTLQIRRTIGDEIVELGRKGRHWRFLAPVETRADAARVAEHIGNLAAARFTAVLLDEPVDLRAFGLEPPFASVLVASTNGESITLLIGDRVSGSTADRYAMIEGTPSIVRISGETASSVLVEAIDLVDRTGSGIAQADVRSIRVLTGDGTLLLERELDRWRVAGGALADLGAVEGLLDVLLSMEAPDIALVDTYPAELEVATIVLEGGGHRPLDTVRVLRELPPPQGQGRWGLENGDGVFRILPSGTRVPLTAVEFSG